MNQSMSVPNLQVVDGPTMEPFGISLVHAPHPDPIRSQAVELTVFNPSLDVQRLIGIHVNVLWLDECIQTLKWNVGGFIDPQDLMKDGWLRAFQKFDMGFFPSRRSGTLSPKGHR